MPASLLQSQLDSLEPDASALEFGEQPSYIQERQF